MRIVYIYYKKICKFYKSVITFFKDFFKVNIHVYMLENSFIAIR